MNAETISAIANGLRKIEREHDCRVLQACESGSRAWGFPSPDSDYDVRFIYLHRRDWYLQIEEQRDTLEWIAPGELDYSGWDLRKALRLFCKCNLSLNEHLQSPIIYEQDDAFAESLRSLIPMYFNPKKAVFHYRSVAANFIEPLRSGEPIRIKKLFYVLRPLLACRWIITFQTMPPTEFSHLVAEADLPSSIIEKIDCFLKQKEAAAEKTMIDVPKFFTDWILALDADVVRLAQTFPISQPPGWEPLNRLFLNML